MLAENANYKNWLEQTRASFDFQWRNLTEGDHLLTDPEFRSSAIRLLESYSALPASWFSGKRTLDAGCGNGRWSRTMSELGAIVTAIDQSEGGIQVSRPRAA